MTKPTNDNKATEQAEATGGCPASVGSVMSSREFEALDPYNRGYAVYMLGTREDQPNVPDESNPYPPRSKDWYSWIRGMARAVIVAQDGEE